MSKDIHTSSHSADWLGPLLFWKQTEVTHSTTTLTLPTLNEKEGNKVVGSQEYQCLDSQDHLPFHSREAPQEFLRAFALVRLFRASMMKQLTSLIQALLDRLTVQPLVPGDHNWNLVGPTGPVSS